MVEIVKACDTIVFAESKFGNCWKYYFGVLTSVCQKISTFSIEKKKDIKNQVRTNSFSAV